MISKLDDSQRAVASIFNSAIAAAAIGAAWEVGFLEELRDKNTVDIPKFATKNNLDINSMKGLASALATVGVAERDHDVAMAGRLLEDAYQAKSVFHWLCLGSGGLFARMQHVLRNENRTGKYYTRDPAAIAYACRDINTQHFDPVFWTAMKGLDYKPQRIVDLGSGSGERLMQVLDKYPGSTGIGIDIANPALDVAAKEASERGFGERLSFTEGDAREMVYRDEFAKVDLLTCFLMGHDFWPRENCVASLQKLRQAFPNARRFFLGDTTRILLDNDDGKHAVTEDDVPAFTLGFEFGHALMGVFIPTLEDWEGVFEEGGWRSVKNHLIHSQSLSVIFELEHA